jgi:16S rRNA (guanine966-N2)-methyltransferase
MARVIAGSAKGRRLVAPKGAHTRPTTDLVREAVFSIIAQWAGTAGGPPESQLDGLSFLDLYAGSGALAFEAASRGAAPVWAVESGHRAAAAIRQNAQTTSLPVRLLATSVEAALARPAEPFDVVWADPPYALPSAQLAAVVEQLPGVWLAKGGLAILERSSRDAPWIWPAGMRERAVRRYGETALYLGESIE